MSVVIKGLHFKLEDFIGLVSSLRTTTTKLTILAFLYCGEFVKNSIGLVSCEANYINHDSCLCVLLTLVH